MKPFFALCVTAFLCNLAQAACPAGESCSLNDLAMAVAALSVGTKNACAKANPAKEQDYAGALERAANAEQAADREALANARNSAQFPAKLAEIEATLAAMPAGELERHCAEFLNIK
jgi:hypothetical protein